MVKILTQLKVRLDYSPRFRTGDIVAVDALKLTPHGLLFRVSHIWKKPQWFHSDWFDGIEDKHESHHRN